MQQSTKKLIRDYGAAIIGAAALALLIRIFVIEAYRIPTPAMRPSLEPGDTVFVAKDPLGLKIFKQSEYRRGDVILFRATDGSSRDYIKRILGLSGETIEIRKGAVFIDGKELAAHIEARGSCGTEEMPGGASSPVCYELPEVANFGPKRIPDDSVFVLGDFRSGSQIDASLQSKSWGIIPKEWFRGKALWVWLSVEPPPLSDVGASSGRFPRVRFERMFRRIQ